MKKRLPTRELERTGTKKLLERAGIAIKNDFYLEASWVLSVILERRVKRIIQRLEGNQKAAGYTLEQVIKRLKYLHLSQHHPELERNISLDLIDRLRQWKNLRNIMLKDMLDVHVSQTRMERLASEGVQLFKEFNKAVKAFKADVSEKEESHA